MKLDNNTALTGAVSAAVTTALGGLNVENIRKFSEDKAQLQTTVRNMAAQMDTIMKNARTAGGGLNSRKVGDELRSLLKDNMDKIQAIHANPESPSQLVLSVRAAAKMTTQNVVDNTDIPEDIIESFSVDAFVPKRQANEWVWSVVARRVNVNITEYKTWLEEGASDGSFAIVAEGAVKGLVSFTLVRNESRYQKIAGKSIYTEEFVRFRREAYQIIQDLFNDKLLRDYADAITARLQAVAVPYTGTSLDGAYENPTDYHAIGAAAAQTETLNFKPDTLVLNPQDKWRIGLSQTQTGEFYVPIPMYNPSGEVTMLGFRVVTSTKQAVGTFTLAEGRLFKVEETPVIIKIGYGITVTKNEDNVVTEVESDFDNNQFRIIGELFFHAYLATNHIGSVVTGNFADIKEALQAA